MYGFVDWQELEGCTDSSFVWSAVEEEELSVMTFFLPLAEGQMGRSSFAMIVNPVGGADLKGTVTSDQLPGVKPHFIG